jgi:hypothetical protein
MFLVVLMLQAHAERHQAPTAQLAIEAHIDAAAPGPAAAVVDEIEAGRVGRSVGTVGITLVESRREPVDVERAGRSHRPRDIEPHGDGRFRRELVVIDRHATAVRREVRDGVAVSQRERDSAAQPAVEAKPHRPDRVRYPLLNA